MKELKEQDQKLQWQEQILLHQVVNTKLKKGDTLSQIAKRHGTTLSALLKKNNIALKDANKLGIGDSLKLPAKVKDRKSVYQGMKKSEMKKMVMPKKKKNGWW